MRRIETLEEGQAHGQLKTLYGEIQRDFGSPFVGSIFRALAKQPGLLEAVWPQLQPDVTTQAFVDLASRIRQRADTLAGLTFDLDDLYTWLHDHRFTREDIRRILYVLEVLHYLNPKLLLATAALTVSVTGIKTSGINRYRATRITKEEPEYPNKIPQVMFEQASNGVKEDYYDISDVMGIPVIPDDFQALAEWPSFLRRIWSMLKPGMRSTTLLNEAQGISQAALELAQELPNPVEVSYPDQQRARQLFETFLSLYARTMVGISAVRWTMIEGQQNARITGWAAGERSAE
ncbi:MAG: halocarboxylic acid dehydrogenase DehI family protein [Armatimonadota bacterium]